MRLLKLTLILALSLGCLHADADHKDKKKKEKTTTTKKAKPKKAALDETYWRLSELNGKMVSQTGNEAYIFMEDGKLTGNTGCNDITGKYNDSRRDNSLKFEPTVTEMACIDKMETEALLLYALKGATRYRLNGDHLMIYNDALLLAIFEAKSI
jgi:putative lipoprotein